MELIKPVFLIGMMGAGKTRTGHRLAELLEVPFLDMDALLVKQAGKSISEIFAQHGEAYFREMEQQWLVQFCSNAFPAIVSTGGGAPCFFSNHERMKTTGISLWLHPPLEVLTERLWRNREERPKIAALPDESAVSDYIRELLQQREACYAQATVVCCDVIPDNETLIASLTAEGALNLG